MIQKGMILVGILFMGFVNKITFQEEEIGKIELEDIKKSYLSDYDQLVISISSLLKKIEDADSSVEEIESDFTDLRKDYKKLEAIFHYYNYDESKRFINAAPIPKLEKNSTSISVLEPYGWQVMDESFCSDTDPRGVLKKNLSKVLQVLQEIQLLQKSVNFEYRHLFEALKNEYIRIYTLTITGFETPCQSATTIELASCAWEGCMKLTEQMSGIGVFPDDLGWEPLLNVLRDGQRYLNRNVDFEIFDRSWFYKNYVKPAIDLTVKIHLESGVETIDEVDHLPTSINYNSVEMFSDSFFNTPYFTVLGEELNQPDLVRLGKKLFNDPILSRAKDMSCASCHQSSKAFTDGETVKRIQDKVQPRNTPTLLNSLYADKYFYDLRAHRILDLYDHILFNDQEFDNDYFHLVRDLENSENYAEEFGTVFRRKSSSISYYNVKLALTAYLQTLTSWNSDFDRYMRGEGNLSEEAVRGFNLFMGKAACGTCHFPPTFSGLVPPAYIDSESEILGVTNRGTNPDSLDSDRGRMINGYLKENTEIFNRSFKTPTIRNIVLTAPYMHNGTFGTLEEVLDFYNSGGGAGLGFDVPHQTLPSDSLNLSENELGQLVAFMETLTDTSSYKFKFHY